MAQTDILEYLRKTPHNTNVNVVKTMLDNSGGGRASTLMITATRDNSTHRDTLDKTYNEIKNAVANGALVIVHFPDDIDGEYIYVVDNYGLVVGVQTKPQDGTHTVAIMNGSYTMEYSVNEADGYPFNYFGD